MYSSHVLVDHARWSLRHDMHISVPQVTNFVRSLCQKCMRKCSSLAVGQYQANVCLCVCCVCMCSLICMWGGKISCVVAEAKKKSATKWACHFDEVPSEGQQDFPCFLCHFQPMDVLHRPAHSKRFVETTNLTSLRYTYMHTYMTQYESKVLNVWSTVHSQRATFMQLNLQFFNETRL